MQQIVQIIGVISGLLSLAGVIYLIGHWKGTVDAKMRALDQYPIAETALMAKTLWDIYIVDALRARPDLVDHSSPYRLKPKALELIPENIRKILDDIPSDQSCSEDISNGWLVVKSVGRSHLEQLARERDISVQETIAILSVYLQGKDNHLNPES